MHGVLKGQRATRLFQTAADCARCGWSNEAIFSLLPDVADRLGLSVYEAERQIWAGIRDETGHEIPPVWLSQGGSKQPEEDPVESSENDEAHAADAQAAESQEAE